MKNRKTKEWICIDNGTDWALIDKSAIQTISYNSGEKWIVFGCGTGNTVSMNCTPEEARAALIGVMGGTDKNQKESGV